MQYRIAGKHEIDERMGGDGYAQTMVELIAQDSSVVHIDCDLAGCSKASEIAKVYPAQVINAGIAEANAVGIAAGLSAAGKIPFVHSFGPFISRRAFDQAFLSAAYAKLNVKLIGSDPGICAAYNGGTHMPFEDCALYLAVPDAIVLDPSDYAMFINLLKKLYAWYGVSYLRMVRKNSARIYEDGADFEIGKGVLLREGNDVTIVASGLLVDEALKAQEILSERGISARVIDMFTWKPLDVELLLQSAAKTGCIVTAENHNCTVGLGAAVARVLAEHCPIPVEMVGVQDRFGQVGAIGFLQEEYRLNAREIVRKAARAVGRKRQ